MASLAIFQPDARAAARLTAALSGEHDLAVHQSWEGLLRALAGEDVEGCLLDADHPNRTGAIHEVGRIRREYPRLAIVALVERTSDVEYYDLGELGVEGVLAGSSNPIKVRSAVAGALAASRATSVGAALEARLRPPGPKAVAWAVEHAGPDATLARLAEAMGQPVSGLRRTLEAAELPTPSGILLRGRLLLAGARLGQDGQTVEEVAFSLGYATASSLSRAMKRHTGLTPRQVSEAGGMNCVRDALFPVGSGRRTATGALRSIALMVAVAAQFGCAGMAGGVSSGVRDEVDRILDSPPLDQVHFGVLAVDARTGRTIYARDPHRKFVPASNQKILVTTAALSLLGPDYRYRTEVWAAGIRSGSTLDGDLVVVAAGDPSFSGRYWASGTEALRALADSIRAAGVEHVTGSVFIDVSAWDSTTVGPTWEFADLPEAYGATGGAFAIDEGELEVIVHAGAAVGSPADVQWTPVVTDGYVRSRVVTSRPDTASEVGATYLPESRQLVLGGTVPYGNTDTLAFALRDPVRQAVHVLEQMLGEAGITVAFGSQVAWVEGARSGRGCLAASVPTCSSATFLTAIHSPPLLKLVAGILGPSQNWMAEQLVRTLGAELGGFGSWDEGLDVVEAFVIEEVGIDSLDVSTRDGSGLSRYNLVTPRALVRLLQHARNASWGSSYRSALAEPAELDATLEERLLDLQARLFAKTGTMSNVNSLSGYLVRNDGAEIIFSVLSNASGLSEGLVTAAIDDVVRALAR